MNRKPLAWIREGDCIVVTSHLPTSEGYIALTRGGKTTKLHRFVCERRHGPLGDSLATHSCDNRRCINPDHLFPGTKKSNAEEMAARGRAGIVKGERVGTSKLTGKAVTEIRSQFGFRKQRALAAEYGVSESAISLIKRGIRWNHV